MSRFAAEPLTINAQVVCDFLNRSGCTRMAEMVAHLDQRCSKHNLEVDALKADISRLHKRLEKHEKSAPEHVQQFYKSEWE